MGLGDGGFGDAHKGMSMVHCLQMKAETSPTVLGFLTELSALDWPASHPVRRRREEVVPLLV